MGDDHLLNMDPSLMTERQQLAFLLRKTAQEQSGAESMSQSSSSSEDEGPSRKAAKTTKKRIPRSTATMAKSSPRNARKTPVHDEASANAARTTHGVVIYSGRGRPPKNSIKLAPGQSAADYEKIVAKSPTNRLLTDAEARQGDLKPTKKLQVKTSTSPRTTSLKEELEHRFDFKSDKPVSSSEKTSPSSTSDVAHMDVFEDHAGQPDFWSLHCALCCQSTSPFAASSEALFLCTSCDKKYPTQRALGRV
ncbi:hypothetical protein Poli38472_014317 [Pythium oligandrum]|uniref:Uncharacterized protein n=1 Tax=Pythium oligandrum TaxID=41045 RepID=A0A8K1C6W6_PYTOL|nr:hypothetical protein Poli38472_014317 [Pythium oligandrum]|eukprot:TMW57714.1 hypothetical protein Poli38472_014317 [Pythium oligandrum]